MLDDILAVCVNIAKEIMGQIKQVYLSHGSTERVSDKHMVIVPVQSVNKDLGPRIHLFQGTGQQGHTVCGQNEISQPSKIKASAWTVDSPRQCHSRISLKKYIALPWALSELFSYLELYGPLGIFPLFLAILSLF